MVEAEIFTTAVAKDVAVTVGYGQIVDEARPKIKVSHKVVIARDLYAVMARAVALLIAPAFGCDRDPVERAEATGDEDATVAIVNANVPYPAVAHVDQRNRVGPAFSKMARIRPKWEFEAHPFDAYFSDIRSEGVHGRLPGELYRKGQRTIDHDRFTVYLRDPSNEIRPSTPRPQLVRRPGVAGVQMFDERQRRIITKLDPHRHPAAEFFRSIHFDPTLTSIGGLDDARQLLPGVAAIDSEEAARPGIVACRTPARRCSHIGSDVFQVLGEIKDRQFRTSTPQDDTRLVDFDEVGNYVAAGRDEDRASPRRLDGATKRFGVVLIVRTIGAEPGDIRDHFDVRQRIISPVISGKGEIGQSAPGLPKLTVAAPELRILGGRRRGKRTDTKCGDNTRSP